MISISIIIPVQSIDLHVFRLITKTVSSITVAFCDIVYDISIIASQSVFDFDCKFVTLLNELPLKLHLENSASHSGALNTGFSLTSCSHLLVLNPGDTLIQGKASDLISIFNDLDKIYFFNVVSDHQYIGSIIKNKFIGTVFSSMKHISVTKFLNFPHQGMLIPRSLHIIGLKYLESLKIRMDYALLCDIMVCFPQTAVQLSPLSLTYYPTGGKSMKIENRHIFYAEEILIYFKYKRLPRLLTFARFLFWKFRASVIMRY